MTIPVNMNAHTVGTKAFFRSAAKHYGCRTWETAARRFAAQHGKAIVHHADDSATIFERHTTDTGTIIQRHNLAKDEVKWFRN